MSTTGERPLEESSYERVQSSPEFADLRARFRRFVFPMSALFLAWYLAYVLLAAYAPGFMSTKLSGNITVGLVIGLLQFVTTFLITIGYARYANRNLDPRAAEIRAQLDRSAR